MQTFTRKQVQKALAKVHEPGRALDRIVEAVLAARGKPACGVPGAVVIDERDLDHARLVAWGVAGHVRWDDVPGVVRDLLELQLLVEANGKGDQVWPLEHEVLAVLSRGPMTRAEIAAAFWNWEVVDLEVNLDDMPTYRRPDGTLAKSVEKAGGKYRWVRPSAAAS